MEHRYFNVGKIVNTHGVKGEVRVIPITDFEERFEPGHRLYFFPEKNTDHIELTVKTHRKHKQFDLLSFNELESINDVEPLKGGTLKVSEHDLHELEEEEFYYYEIIGCEVVLTDGTFIGEVKEILSPGANDVWVVKRKGMKDALIPYIEPIVREIDLDKRQIKIEDMEGMLDG